VIEAGEMARSGETYVLDMGEPVRIEDLVRRFAAELDATPDIVYTGLRPGEKLHEELLDDAERMTRTRHPRVSAVVADGVDGDRLLDEVERLGLAVVVDDEDELRARLWNLVRDNAGAELVAAR
jgi:FlaA1/EpsC-like NDP-sugar epimerase